MKLKKMEVVFSNLKNTPSVWFECYETSKYNGFNTDPTTTNEYWLNDRCVGLSSDNWRTDKTFYI